MNKAHKKIFVFDVDGTICTNTNGKYDEAKPFPDMLRRVNNLYDLGHKIVFMTARGSVSKIDYTEKTKKQLAEWGFKYHELIMNKKPHADLFVDDRGVNVSEWRTEGKIKGFVASSFDLIHPGYIKMFIDAKTVCEHLICAIQSDPTIDRPTKNKPVQTLKERVMVLEAIRYVDEVVVYNTEEELVQLLKDIEPDIRILGTDYEGKNFTGSDLPIKIHWHKRDHEWSTSGLRKKVCLTEEGKQSEPATITPKNYHQLLADVLEEAKKNKFAWSKELTASISSDLHRKYFINSPPGSGGFYHFISLLVHKMQPELVVELGSCKGLGILSVMHTLPKNSKLITFDIKRQLQFVPEYIHKDERLKFVLGNCLNKQLVKNNITKPIDLLVCDTLHSYEQIKGEMETFIPHLADKAIILVDDLDYKQTNRGKRKYYNQWDGEKMDLTEYCHSSGYGALIYSRRKK